MTKKNLLLLFSILLVLFCSRMEDNKTRTIKSFYSNGNLKVKAEITSDSTFNGEYREYHENGELKARGLVLKDKREKEWAYYDETGSMTAKGTYEKGLKKGSWEYVVKESTYEVEWKIHQDTLAGFKINIPASWAVKEREEMAAPNILLAASRESNSSFSDNFNLTLLGKNEDTEFKNLVKDYVGYLMERQKDLAPKVMETKQTIINSTEAIYSLVKLEKHEHQILIWQFYFNRPDGVYLVSFFIQEESFDSTRKLFQEIAFSLHFI